MISRHRTSRPSAQRRFLLPLLSLALATSALAALPAGPFATRATAATDRLPDLRMAKLSDFHIVTTSSGRRLLRFTALMLNLGAGAFEVRSTRPNTSTPWDINQVVFDDAGGSRNVDTTATMTYGGDGHGHWHIASVVDSDLFNENRTVHGSKIGFCFFDTTLWSPSLPGSPASPRYRETDCARQSELVNTSGISVGWGDLYQWTLPMQWIDITDVPAGDYYLRSIVDARDRFLESSNTNNCTYTRIRINASGTGYTVLGTGAVCVTDWATSPFADDIAWLYAAGLTTGCGIELFCPNRAVPRAEMASFLVRAFAIPASKVDAFTDDDGSTHEPDINALAAVGLTTGCGPPGYCPDRTVTRAEISSFLARALGLPTTTIDSFADDEGISHEWAINALAAAGITTGCGPAAFCPNQSMLRGQMAAFLHRALG